MATTYEWAPDNSRMRSACMALSGSSELLIPLWPATPLLWTWTGSALVSSAPAVPQQNGFGSCAADNASGVWAAQYTGDLVYCLGAGVTGYALPAGQIITGTAFVPNFNSPYTVSSVGNVYQGSGSTFLGNVSVAAWGLESSGSTLFTLASGGVGTFGLTLFNAGSPGFIEYPMDQGLCLAASTPASAIAVGGYRDFTFASGYTRMAFSPANAVMLAFNSGPSFDLYLGPNEAWALSSTYAVGNNTGNAAWASGGTSVLVTDQINGLVTVYAYSLGILTSSQVMVVPQAGAIAISPDTTKALVVQPGLNSVTPLTLSGSTWVVSGATVFCNDPQAVLFQSNTSAVVGGASGLEFLQFSSNVWNISGSVALPYVPVTVLTASGNLFACGTAAGSGYFSAVSGTHSLLFQYTWGGSADGMIYEQGQIWVTDKTTPMLWAFGNLFSAYNFVFNIPPSQQFNNIFVSPFTAFSSGGTVFGLGNTTTSLYTLTSPYNIEPLRSGVVSVMAGGASAFSTAVLGTGQVPTAITLDATGNAWAVTLQNELYEISPTGTVLSSSQVTQFSGQAQTTPLGISSLVFIGAHLWGASSLAGPLVQLT